MSWRRARVAREVRHLAKRVCFVFAVARHFFCIQPVAVQLVAVAHRYVLLVAALLVAPTDVITRAARRKAEGGDATDWDRRGGRPPPFVRRPDSWKAVTEVSSRPRSAMRGMASKASQILCVNLRQCDLAFFTSREFTAQFSPTVPGRPKPVASGFTGDKGGTGSGQRPKMPKVPKDTGTRCRAVDISFVRRLTAARRLTAEGRVEKRYLGEQLPARRRALLAARVWSNDADLPHAASTNPAVVPRGRSPSSSSRSTAPSAHASGGRSRRSSM